MNLNDENRRKEDRVPVRFPIRYFFVHATEDRKTKQFRAGTTMNVSQYGVAFLAVIVDPTIIPPALQGDILVALEVTLPDNEIVGTTCRLAWADKPDGHAVGDEYLVGIEYTDMEDAARLKLYNAAKRAAGRV